MQETQLETITYAYDIANHLTEADYDNGLYYNYTYDPLRVASSQGAIVWFLP